MDDAGCTRSLKFFMPIHAEVAELRKEVASKVGNLSETDVTLLTCDGRVVAHSNLALVQAFGRSDALHVDARVKVLADRDVQLTYVESLLHFSWTVKCQSDPEMSALSVSADGKIGSNQCSWCAAVFVSRSDELVAALNKPIFEEVYNDCVKEGSLLRSKHGYLTYGENVNNDLLIKHVHFHVLSQESFSHRPDNDLLDMLPEDLRKEFYVCDREVDNLDLAITKILHGSRKFLISRFGLSFAALMISDDSYLVLDSHVRQVGLMKLHSFKKYIKMGADSF